MSPTAAARRLSDRALLVALAVCAVLLVTAVVVAVLVVRVPAMEPVPVPRASSA